jgi:uncharacterized protein YfiM (DUF2279 family)
MTPWVLALTILAAAGGATTGTPSTGGPAAIAWRIPRARVGVAAVAVPAPLLREGRDRAGQSRADPMIGEDKLQHLGMAFAVTEVGFGVARLGLSAQDALAAAVGAALTAAVGKEISDLREGRSFSVRDLTWDLAGIALGAVLASQTE